MRYFLTVLTLLFSISSASAEIIPGEYLVKFRKLPKASGFRRLAGELGGAEVKVVIREHRVVLVKPGRSRLPDEDFVDRLRARKDVEFVQSRFIYRTQLFVAQEVYAAMRRALDEGLPFPVPDLPLPGQPPSGKPEVKPAPESAAGEDPLLAKDKDLELASVRDAWTTETGKPSIVVAVIDTGVDYNHEDLAANMWRNPKEPTRVGWDFVDDDAKPFDVTEGINPFTGGGNPGHGTHCAGNVGAAGHNTLGTSGVSQKVSIMALRMLNQNGEGETVAAVKSIDFAVDHGARIISASWGSEGSREEDHLVKQAIERALAKGILFVAAAGNTNPAEQPTADNDTNAERRAFPASFDLPNIISVAASNQKGELADFTHFGAKTVHIAAPGERSFSTIPENRDPVFFQGSAKYEDGFQLPFLGAVPWNGTSMATPQVAGAAALVWSRHPEWTFDQVKERILASARPEATLAGKVATGGVLDVRKAIQDKE